MQVRTACYNYFIAVTLCCSCKFRDLALLSTRYVWPEDFFVLSLDWKTATLTLHSFRFSQAVQRRAGTADRAAEVAECSSDEQGGI